MRDWVEALQRLGREGQDAVLVTLASGKGSTPREAGAKMLVTGDAIRGSIGGGEAEFQAVSMARELLASTDARRARRYRLGTSFGQNCGGIADLAFERVPAGAQWVAVLADWVGAGRACVLATPAGEAPEDARLVIEASAHHGTLGDGARDERAIDQGRRMLAARDRTCRLVPIDADLEARFELVEPLDFAIVLFGAGHVGRALARVLGAVQARITWVDSRAHEFPRDVPENVRVVLTDAPLEQVPAAGPGSWFLVATHSHALDLDLVEAILRRDDFAFCGMLGSATKRRTFEAGLAKRGVRDLARLVCPVGIPSLSGKDPGTIAVAIAAQLLQEREHAIRNAHPSRQPANGR
ncbi:MAG: xanthine dehydrogenase accessory protein XdhC [Burkholderiales bacterium]|nr:xanthine dehydrogenase accessory protein XdhC [Burkholderiales bacterium]